MNEEERELLSGKCKDREWQSGRQTEPKTVANRLGKQRVNETKNE